MRRLFRTFAKLTVVACGGWCSAAACHAGPYPAGYAAVPPAGAGGAAPYPYPGFQPGPGAFPGVTPAMTMLPTSAEAPMTTPNRFFGGGAGAQAYAGYTGYAGYAAPMAPTPTPAGFMPAGPLPGHGPWVPPSMGLAPMPPDGPPVGTSRFPGWVSRYASALADGAANSPPAGTPGTGPALPPGQPATPSAPSPVPSARPAPYALPAPYRTPYGVMPGYGMYPPQAYAAPGYCPPVIPAPIYPSPAANVRYLKSRDDRLKEKADQVADHLRDRVEVEADALLWWIRNEPGAPLVSTGPGTSVPAFRGAQTTLYGSSFDENPFAGVRARGAYWLTCDHLLGIDAAGFVLEQKSTGFAANSAGSGPAVLGRPFTNAVTGLPDVALVGFPGGLSGTIAVSSVSQMWGAELNARSRFWCGDGFALTAQAGARYLQLNESLDVDQRSTVLPGATAGFQGAVVGPGNTLALGDRFAARNQFFGGQFGLLGDMTFGHLSVNVLGKLALGNTHEVTDLTGQTTLLRPGLAPATAQGGLLVLPTNQGRLTRDAFTLVPEAGLTVGYQFTAHLKATLGYSFLYWSDVARPGEQVNSTINVARVPSSSSFSPKSGPAAPAPGLSSSDFWAQGLNLGFLVQY